MGLQFLFHTNFGLSLRVMKRGGIFICYAGGSTRDRYPLSIWRSCGTTRVLDGSIKEWATRWLFLSFTHRWFCLPFQRRRDVWDIYDGHESDLPEELPGHDACITITGNKIIVYPMNLFARSAVSHSSSSSIASGLCRKFISPCSQIYRSAKRSLTLQAPSNLFRDTCLSLCDFYLIFNVPVTPLIHPTAPISTRFRQDGLHMASPIIRPQGRGECQLP